MKRPVAILPMRISLRRARPDLGSGRSIRGKSILTIQQRKTNSSTIEPRPVRTIAIHLTLFCSIGGGSKEMHATRICQTQKPSGPQSDVDGTPGHLHAKVAQQVGAYSKLKWDGPVRVPKSQLRSRKTKANFPYTYILEALP